MMRNGEFTKVAEPVIYTDSEDSQKQVLDSEATEEGYPLPPLFVSDDGSNEPTKLPIQAVLVSKKNEKSRGMEYIDWRPIAQLSTLDELLEQFGPGCYIVSGRLMDRRTIVRARMVSVGLADSPRSAEPIMVNPRGEFDIAKLATGVSAALGPVLTFVTGLLTQRAQERDRDRELDRQRISEDRARTEKMFEQMMAMVTTTMSARHEDTASLVQALLSAKTDSSGGPTEAKAYKDGQADALEMLATMRDAGVLGTDAESQVIGLLQSFATGAKQPPPKVAPPASPPTPEPNAL